MSHSSVAQAELLAATLQQAVSEFRPSSLAILGVAGGNGLERVDPTGVRRVVALDFNREFLGLCTQRHAHRFTRYEAVLHDLTTGTPAFEAVDLIFAGLLLEYLDCRAFFEYLPSLLSPQGVFVTLLQLPSSELPAVSRSPFTSLGQLESVFHFVDPGIMRTALARRDFFLCSEKIVRLKSQKEFHFAAFRLTNAPSTPPGAAQAVADRKD